jgi:hypothetical protein
MDLQGAVDGRKNKRKRNTMRKLTLMLLAAMLLAVFPLSADTYKYIGPEYSGATITYSGDTAPVGPYQLEDTNTGVYFYADCISGFSELINGNWSAGFDPVTDYSSAWAPTTVPPASSTTFVGGESAVTPDLEKMAWLDEQFSSYSTTPTVIDAIQEAIWYFSGVAGGSDTGTISSTAASAYWVKLAQDLTTATLNTLKNSEALVPAATGNESQVFLIPVSTPEPATLSLVGLALLGLGILSKRKAARVA